MKSQNKGDLLEMNNEAHKEVANGLLYTHTRINTATAKTIEASSFLYALIELLSEKGLISIEELDERKTQVAQRLIKKFVDSGIGLLYQDSEDDKYTFEKETEVDCLSRLHICKAICCKFPFALSKQDVEEGMIRWEFGRPYLIAHDTDGYCVHMDRKSYHCTVRERRPVPCRGFTCENNQKWRVWNDYEVKVINQELIEKINQDNSKIYAISKLRSNGGEIGSP